MESKLKHSNTLAKKKNNEILDFTTTAQESLFLAKRAELPKIIKKRRKQFIKELEDYKIIKVENEEQDNTQYATIVDKKIPMYELSQHCFDPLIKWTGIIPKYSATELMVIFDYFKECVNEINKTELIPPTKEMFCTLCGISTNIFSQWKNSADAELREVMYQIEDYIANFLTMGGLTRKISEVTGIFIQKSSLGRKEATDVQPLFQQNNVILQDSMLKDLMEKF